MAELFDAFPRLEGRLVTIRKMEESDVDALAEITQNENVYRYIPPFLFQKSRTQLLTAIRNLGGRDFDKKKLIIAGVYPLAEPQRLVGLAEMFDYRKSRSQITIGYRFNEGDWHKGFATETVALLREYLAGEMRLATLKAFVMPQNVYSARALLANGFHAEAEAAQGRNWGGQDAAELTEYTYQRNES